MPSNKSNTPVARLPVEPQRRHGKARVARLLETGASVIAEKGYEGATMAEIAERAGSPIGSLYRFFPNKETLANALIERYRGLIGDTFAQINELAAAARLEETADALLSALMDLKPETKTMRALLEGRSEWSAKRMEFRQAALKQIARTLKLLAPKLSTATARNIAVVVFHNMKTFAALKLGENVASSPGALEELRLMNRIYLTNRLSTFRG